MTWNEIIAENEAEARATLSTETCPECGAILADHYDAFGYWRPCTNIKPGDIVSRFGFRFKVETVHIVEGRFAHIQIAGVDMAGKPYGPVRSGEVKIIRRTAAE